MNNTATNTATCPTVRKQIGKTTYIVRVHFSQTAKETMEDKIKRLAPQEIKMLFAVLPETKSQGLFHQIQKEVTFCGLPHGAYA